MCEFGLVSMAFSHFQIVQVIWLHTDTLTATHRIFSVQLLIFPVWCNTVNIFKRFSARAKACPCPSTAYVIKLLFAAPQRSLSPQVQHSRFVKCPSDTPAQCPLGDT